MKEIINIDHLIFSYKIRRCFIAYLIIAIIGLMLLLLALPTVIARRIVERQKREGLFKTKKQA